MAARGRTAGFKMPEEHRTKIANSKVLSRLVEFAEGKDGVDMSPHQVTAALGLLKKVLPDISENRLANEEGGKITVTTISLVAPGQDASDT